MRKMISNSRLLWVVLMVGCGGSSGDDYSKTPKAPEPAPTETSGYSDTKTPSDTTTTVETTPTPPAAEPTAGAPGGAAAPMVGEETGTGMPAGQGTTPSTAPGTSPAKPVPGTATGGTSPSDPANVGYGQTPQKAEAHVKMLKGNADVGTITFTQSGRQVSISGQFTGLKKGPHGFHIHEKGDCTGKDAKNAGGHFNPTGAKHGPPESGTRHAGDFGNLVADEGGYATFEMTTDSLTVEPGTDSVVGKAIVIHAKKDDGKSQPSGNAGPAIACGVIEVSSTSTPAKSE